MCRFGDKDACMQLFLHQVKPLVQREERRVGGTPKDNVYSSVVP